jgi:hypothetical protein
VDFTTALAGSLTESSRRTTFDTAQTEIGSMPTYRKMQDPLPRCFDFNAAVPLQFRKAKSIKVLRRRD